MQQSKTPAKRKKKSRVSEKQREKSKRVMNNASHPSNPSQQRKPHLRILPPIVNSHIEKEILRQLVLSCIAMHRTLVKKKGHQAHNFSFHKKVGFLNKRMSLPEIGRSQFEEVKK